MAKSVGEVDLVQHFFRTRQVNLVALLCVIFSSHQAKNTAHTNFLSTVMACCLHSEKYLQNTCVSVTCHLQTDPVFHCNWQVGIHKVGCKRVIRNWLLEHIFTGIFHVLFKLPYYAGLYVRIIQL